VTNPRRGLHAGAALAAATLRPIGRQRHGADVAGMRNGDDHVLALDQVLILHLAFLIDDHGAAGRGEFFLDGGEFVLEDRLDARAASAKYRDNQRSRRRALSSSALISSRPSAVSRCRRRSRMALACSAESRVVPAADMLWRGSSISVTMVSTARAGPVAVHQLLARLVGVLGAADQFGLLRRY